MNFSSDSGLGRVPFLGLLLGLVLSCAGCKMYGDSADDLGIHPAQVSEVGYVGTWGSANDTLTIGGDARFNERACGTSGTIEYTSRNDSCSAGGTCGNSTFDVKVSSGRYGCRPVGQDICLFSFSDGGQTLTLACASGKMIYRRL